MFVYLLQIEITFIGINPVHCDVILNISFEESCRSAAQTVGGIVCPYRKESAPQCSTRVLTWLVCSQYCRDCVRRRRGMTR